MVSNTLAQTTNYSITAGSGTLTYSVTVSTSSTCPYGSGNGPQETITQYLFNTFAYNNQSLSGSGTYVSYPYTSSYCPPSGWQGTDPLVLTGSNYTVFFTPTLTGTIGPGTATLDAIAVSAIPVTGVYGSTVQFTATEAYPNASGTVTFSDGSTTLGSVTMQTGSNSTANFSVSTLAAGTHSITAAFSNGNVPAATSPALSFTVNQAPLTVTANNASRVYGVANPVFSPTYSGFVNGDTQAVVSGSPSMSSPATPSSPVGSYQIVITVGTLSAANYSFSTFVAGTLSVVQNALGLPSAGDITTVAGSGYDGYSGDNGPAISAGLNYPLGASIDSSGNLYIADDANNRIREVNAATGKIITVAGNGTAGYAGDGAAATNAKLHNPAGTAIDSSGNIYIADELNNAIRKVTVSSGIITTVAGNGTQGSGGDGGPATNANLYHPLGVALDSSGNLYIADASNNRIQEVTSTTGIITTIAGTTSGGYSGDGGLAVNAKLCSPSSVALDSQNNIYIADSCNNRVRKITASSGIITTVAGSSGSGYSGDGGPATSATMFWPTAVAVDASSNIYILEGRTSAAPNPANCGLREVLAANNSTGYGAGNIYTIGGNGVCGYSGDGGTSTDAYLNDGYGDSIAIDPLGNIFFPDESNFRIRAVGHTITLTPTIAWPPPPAIPVGTALSATQLDAVTDVPSSCAYSVSGGSAVQVGTVLALGTYTLSVTCTPTGTTAYSPGTDTVSLTVAQPTQITWAAPVAITYGTALSATQLNASASVLGTFTYSPALGTILGAGAQTLSVTFTPTNNASYPTATASVLLTVNQATPPVTWPPPADISSGTALSSTQLNASSTVAGTSFVYYPPAGTVLSVGPHALMVIFTPTDTTDYTTASVSAYVNVTEDVGTWDSGTIKLTVNGSTVATVPYGQTSTPSSIAKALASAASTSPVYVSAVDDTLSIEAATTGSTSNPTDYSYTLVATSNNPTVFNPPSFGASPASGNLSGGAASQSSGTSTPVYSYTVGSYDGASNLLQYSDSVMGSWSFSNAGASGYDSLDRVSAATQTPVTGTAQSFCWTYDTFGNRTTQAISNLAFSSATGASACQFASGATLLANTVATYPNPNNQIGSTNASGATFDPNYDAAGNITNDGRNQYLYDGDGRICAVYSSLVPGIWSMTGYLYDADGTRVAKGTITAWSCDPTLSGFTTTNDYILGPSGEQATEMGVGGALEGSTSSGITWQHTNVWAGGKLLATYDGDALNGTDLTGGLHYYFDDPLGTRRVQTDYAGNIEKSCSSLPFGDQESCGPTPTEHLFTGKERDTESGNDYFGARYYASSMGRFLSPDWSAKVMPVPYAKLDNPQSLNLYSYVWNNPLSRADADGHTATCGAGANAGTCAADLNKLAPGTKVAADGTVSKGSLLQRIVNHLDGNGAGQSLVSRIVNDSHLTTITADPGNPRGGQQLNGDVKYDPAGANIMTRGADGNLTGAHASGAVVLGHELIHQDHENRGLQDMSPADHIFSNAGGMFSETVNREEFRTTGFSPFVMPGDITENQLERQLGAPVRATYTSGGWAPVPPQP
jgi:RHS repeat-associated protein